MQYTEILYLIKQEDYQDEIGNVIHNEKENKIYAKRNVVGSKEYYNAVAVGITPTAELQIKKTNYNNEEEAIYNDKRYSVIRTIPKGNNDLIIVLGIKTGVN